MSLSGSFFHGSSLSFFIRFSFCPPLAVSHSPEMPALYVSSYNNRMMAYDASKRFENSVFTFQLCGK